MSDSKFCPSCGTKLAAASAFCYNCGQKQEIMPAFSPPPESQETDNADSISQPAADQHEERLPEVSVSQEPVMEAEQEADLPQKPDDISAPEMPESEARDAEDAEEPPIHEISDESPHDSHEAEESSEPAAFDKQPEAGEIQNESVRPVAVPIQPAAPSQPAVSPTFTEPQNLPQYQQPYYPQAPLPQQPQPFPWFFTFFWVIMLGAVGVWAYFLLAHPTYDYPVFTEDAKRIMLFALSVALLVYTVSLKLSMKKFRAFPTIVLVAAAIVIFYFFCMWELTDGDWLHDTLSEVTNNILPAFGD